MQAIDNSGIINYNANFTYPGFKPAMSYVYDAVLHTVTVDTDAMLLPAVAGVAGKFSANIQVHDEYGGTAHGKIGPMVAVGSSGGAIDVSALDTNKGLNITATIVANIGWSATGSAFDIGANGNLRDWNIADQPAQADESLIT